MKKSTALASPKPEAAEAAEAAADRCYYMISAALNIMESTFSDQKLHERVTGKKNVFYCPPKQIDLIFYLIYEAADNAIALRDRLST